MEDQIKIVKKARQDRLSQAKGRKSKRSYVTEIENLHVLLAWSEGVLSEGQAAAVLNVDRVTARTMKQRACSSGNALWWIMTQAKRRVADNEIEREGTSENAVHRKP